MTPLARLAWGLILVAVDLRINHGIDLVPDPLGWWLAAVALVDLSDHHRAFVLAARLALVAALLSVPDFIAPGGSVLVLGGGVLVLAVAVATLTGIAETASAALAERARAIRAWTVGLTALLALTLALAAVEPASGVLVLVAGSADFVVFVWLLAFLFRTAKDPSPVAGASVVA